LAGTVLLTATAATAATPGTATHAPPDAIAVSTNCHYHYDGNVYWAHCYPTDGPYSFRMHLWCDVGFGYPATSNWARSPDQIYTDGVNCGPGAGAAESAWVDTSG
jgi:hypothetical protein